MTAAAVAGHGAYYAMEPEGDINDGLGSPSIGGGGGGAYGSGGDDGELELTREEQTFQQSKYYVRPVPSLEELRSLRVASRDGGSRYM